MVREWYHGSYPGEGMVPCAKDCLEGADSFPDSSLLAEGGFYCDGALFMALRTEESPSSGFSVHFLLWEEMVSMS